MKQLEVPFLAGNGQLTDLEQVADLLDAQPFHALAEQPWPLYRNRVQASFAIAHSGEAIYLKFRVAEPYVLATCRQANEPVYRDSCVEFFLAPGPDRQTYYNLEFNCTGTCLMGYGPQNLARREYLPATLSDKIRRRARLQAGGEAGAPGLLSWDLTLVIPLEVFCYHPMSSLQKLSGSANFYKCGDKLPQPHFLTWNPIEAPEPNFHLPAFFGDIHFLEAGAVVSATSQSAYLKS